MRLDINLASRKYEDMREFFLRWSVSLAVLAGLTAMLATLAFLSHSHSAKAQREIKDLQQKVATLQKQRQQLIDFENRPENLDVKQQKKFWNEQIARRSLSWTQLLNDLQKIMPNRAYLNSVEPELTKDNRLMLKLVISGESRDDARELQTRMEGSTRFHAPRIETEGWEKGEKGASLLYKFEIGTEYTPAGAAPEDPSPRDPSRRGAGAAQRSGTKEAG